MQMRPDVIFFLTDADDPMPKSELEEIADLNRRAGVVISTIEFGRGPAEQAKNSHRLRGSTGGQYGYVDTRSLRVRRSERVVADFFGLGGLPTRGCRLPGSANVVDAELRRVARPDRRRAVRTAELSAAGVVAAELVVDRSSRELPTPQPQLVCIVAVGGTTSDTGLRRRCASTVCSKNPEQCVAAHRPHDRSGGKGLGGGGGEHCGREPTAIKSRRFIFVSE